MQQQCPIISYLSRIEAHICSKSKHMIATRIYFTKGVPDHVSGFSAVGDLMLTNPSCNSQMKMLLCRLHLTLRRSGFAWRLFLSDCYRNTYTPETQVLPTRQWKMNYPLFSHFSLPYPLSHHIAASLLLPLISAIAAFGCNWIQILARFAVALMIS